MKIKLANNLALSLLILPILLSGCTLFSLEPSGTKDDKTNGGLWWSDTAGATWQQRSLIATATGRLQNFFSADALSISLDPSDNQAVYFGSLDSGLLYSYDQAKSWQLARQLGSRPVTRLAIDPADKCTIYLASQNKVLKSLDCSRSFKEIYTDNNPGVLVSALAIDHYNSQIIYLGTTAGQIIKSQNAGQSWQTQANLKAIVKKLLLSPHDSRVLMAATDTKGLWRSLDAGRNWTDLAPSLKPFANSKKVRDLVFSVKTPGLWLLATSYGLLQTVNNGDNWTEIKLLPPERQADINAVAVSQINPLVIYYVTDTNLYSSVDGGQNWTTKSLPTSRRGAVLQLDPKNDRMIYLGVRQE